MKPILTKREVEPIRKLCNHPSADTMLRILDTIEQAVELLRMSLHQSAGVQDYQLREAINAFLARYDGTNTNGKDGE